ncbi:hypothetical protein D9M68_665420 [compost metagenome]
MPFLVSGINQIFFSRSTCRHSAHSSSPIRQHVASVIHTAASVVASSAASGSCRLSWRISSSVRTLSRSTSFPPILALRMLAVGSCSRKSRSTANRNICRINEKINLAIRLTPRARIASVTSVMWPFLMSSTARLHRSGSTSFSNIRRTSVPPSLRLIRSTLAQCSKSSRTFLRLAWRACSASAVAFSLANRASSASRAAMRAAPSASRCSRRSVTPLK